MDNLLNPNVAIPHYSPILSPLPTHHHTENQNLAALHGVSELSGLTLKKRVTSLAINRLLLWIRSHFVSTYLQAKIALATGRVFDFYSCLPLPE